MKSFIKQNAFYAATLLIVSLIAGACNKEENKPAATPSEEEAVAVVEGAFIADSEGLSKEVSDAVYVADQYTVKTVTGPCGQAFDSTVVRSYTTARVTANYTTSWAWTVNCNNLGIPASVDYNRTAQGSYETMRMLSNDNAAGQWMVDNLVTGENYVLNGSYTRQGTQTSKVGNHNNFSSTLTVSASDINVDKGTRRISSGTASFTLAGTASTGESFSFQGSAIFNGNGEVVITINGHTYTIDLY